MLLQLGIGTQKEKAMDKLQDLSDLFLDVLEDINEDHKTALHKILEKFLNYRQSKPDREVFQTTSEGNRLSFGQRINCFGEFINLFVKFKSLQSEQRRF